MPTGVCANADNAPIASNSCRVALKRAHTPLREVCGLVVGVAMPTKSVLEAIESHDVPSDSHVDNSPPLVKIAPAALANDAVSPDCAGAEPRSLAPVRVTT
jgi:hypothetical protein